MNVKSIKTKILGVLTLMTCCLFLYPISTHAATVTMPTSSLKVSYDNRESNSDGQGAKTNPSSAALNQSPWVQLVQLSYTPYYSFEDQTSISFSLGVNGDNTRDSSRIWYGNQLRLVDSSGKYVILGDASTSGTQNNGAWDSLKETSYTYNPQNAKNTINLGNARLEWWGYTRVEAIFGGSGFSRIAVSNITTSKTLSGPHSHSYTLT